MSVVTNSAQRVSDRITMAKRSGMMQESPDCDNSGSARPAWCSLHHTAAGPGTHFTVAANTGKVRDSTPRGGRFGFRASPPTPRRPTRPSKRSSRRSPRHHPASCPFHHHPGPCRSRLHHQPRRHLVRARCPSSRRLPAAGRCRPPRRDCRSPRHQPACRCHCGRTTRRHPSSRSACRPVFHRRASRCRRHR